MNKKLLIFTICFACLIGGIVFAEGLGISNPLGIDSFDELVAALIAFARDVALVLVPIFIIWGAFMLITAAGDTAKISQGKKAITYALLGLFIVLAAQAILNTLQDIVNV